MEAVCLTLVSGFSVVFIVHYGLSYIECHEDGTFELGKGRQSRVRFAFFEMGVSVIGGAVTTIGASIFLFFCDLTIFAQFGRFMCTTIVLSILYANTLFMSILALLGPEGKQGQLCRGKSDADTTVADEPDDAGTSKPI
jgi:predicted RND superfamily exporter protein